MIEIDILQFIQEHWQMGFLWILKIASDARKDHKELHKDIVNALNDHGERIAKLEGKSNK